MIDHARHVPLRPIPWSESDATAAIEDIVADGLEHFDAERFWPAHPLDEGIRDGHTSLYFGATGVIWGIDYLGRVGATKARFDFRPVLQRLLEASQAEFAKWKYAAHGAAGPLAKGSNLCHGTGGNGYALLKLYRRTNDLIWLEHARSFAMTALAQYREACDQLGRGRYSLWTGDIGLAVYLWDCLTAEPQFPTIDVF